MLVQTQHLYPSIELKIAATSVFSITVVCRACLVPPAIIHRPLQRRIVMLCLPRPEHLASYDGGRKAEAVLQDL